MNFDEAVWSYEISPAVEALQAQYVDNFADEQKSKIEELRSRMGDSLKIKIHKDFYLSKWLIAKNWDLEAATTMLKAHLKWRKEVRVDRIHEEYIPQKVFLKYVPIGIIGDAKNGSPFYILNLGNVDPMGVFYSEDLKDLMKYLIYNFEYGEKLMLANTEKYGRIVNNYTALVDMRNFPYKYSLRKTSFEFIVKFLGILENHYPGIVGKIFVINMARALSVCYGIFKAFLSDDTISRLLIFNKTDPWKEAVLEHVDKEQLPVHWGGTKVDIVDGNPFCSSQISLGGAVPKSFYKISRDRMRVANELNFVEVKNRKSLTVDIEIPEKGCTLTWSFWTEEHDIGFGINKGTVCLLPLQRYHCELQPQKGSLQCQEPGTYTLIFDNTFSIFRYKKLCYEFEIIPTAEENTYL